MPYADLEKRREVWRKSKAKSYQSSEEFRMAEAARKAEWYQENKAQCRERLRLWRERNKLNG